MARPLASINRNHGKGKRSEIKKEEYPQVKSRLSSDIVKYLRQNKKTLKEIGKLTGLSEAYISRVGKGERNFRVDHMVKLEEALGKPLPLLLIEARKRDSLSKQMRPFYRSLRKSFELSARLRAKFVKNREKSESTHTDSR